MNDSISNGGEVEMDLDEMEVAEGTDGKSNARGNAESGSDYVTYQFEKSYPGRLDANKTLTKEQASEEALTKERASEELTTELLSGIDWEELEGFDNLENGNDTSSTRPNSGSTIGETSSTIRESSPISPQLEAMYPGDTVDRVETRIATERSRLNGAKLGGERVAEFFIEAAPQTRDSYCRAGRAFNNSGSFSEVTADSHEVKLNGKVVLFIGHSPPHAASPGWLELGDESLSGRFMFAFAEALTASTGTKVLAYDLDFVPPSKEELSQRVLRGEPGWSPPIRDGRFVRVAKLFIDNIDAEVVGVVVAGFQAAKALKTGTGKGLTRFGENSILKNSNVGAVVNIYHPRVTLAPLNAGDLSFNLFREVSICFRVCGGGGSIEPVWNMFRASFRQLAGLPWQLLTIDQISAHCREFLSDTLDYRKLPFSMLISLEVRIGSTKYTGGIKALIEAGVAKHGSQSAFFSHAGRCSWDKAVADAGGSIELAKAERVNRLNDGLVRKFGSLEAAHRNSGKMLKNWWIENRAYSFLVKQVPEKDAGKVFFQHSDEKGLCNQIFPFIECLDLPAPRANNRTSIEAFQKPSKPFLLPTACPLGASCPAIDASKNRFGSLLTSKTVSLLGPDSEEVVTGGQIRTQIIAGRYSEHSVASNPFDIAAGRSAVSPPYQIKWRRKPIPKSKPPTGTNPWSIMGAVRTEGTGGGTVARDGKARTDCREKETEVIVIDDSDDEADPTLQYKNKTPMSKGFIKKVIERVRGEDLDWLDELTIREDIELQSKFFHIEVPNSDEAVQVLATAIRRGF